MKRTGIIFIAKLFVLAVQAQEIKVPATITPHHPRLLTNDKEKPRLQKLIGTTDWARNTWEQAKKRIEEYVDRHQADSTWIVSRLQMYWKTRSTDVFIKGGVYDHAAGEAPVPTVRFTGTRDAVTVFTAPKLEDIVPYMDDPRGLYYANRSKPGQPLEWVEQAKTGRVVESINRQIMGMAQNAAIVYWYTGEEKYAKFAYDLFNTYMMGIYYRKEPVDLNHGHNQTLVGLTSFEVIHEDILNELTVCYDFLYNYIGHHAPGNLPLYAAAFKKWAGLIIQNGVPFNNWDLIEARFVAMVALVLENNNTYTDGRGCSYYLDQLLNKTAVRQWSLTELIKRGYDPNTGIWSESPGYSQMVINEFMQFVTLFDRVLDFDLLEQLPILKKAVLSTSQYLLPNGYAVSFGDSHYGRLSTAPARQVVMNARRHNKPEQEEQFTRMIKMVNALSAEAVTKADDLVSLLTYADLTLKENIPAGQLPEFVSPLFYSPNVSWLIQRSGTGPQQALAISLNGSLGNHMHANGISLELYGKGLPLAPEAGIGTSYFQPDYAEYYSKFPAHNTVVVDGISSYPEMRSNHGFQVKSCYPASGIKTGIFPLITFADLYFREPETNASQQRMMSIIRTSDTTGYYIDVFRSARKEGGDKYHDYFYHNIGQEVVVQEPGGKALDLQPVDKLAFANGDLFAYDYLYDERSVRTNSDIKATFRLKLPGSDSIFMHMWMKGSTDRELFTVKSPRSMAIDRGIVPKEIAALPLPTIVARQYGEAWTKPFVSVFEPASGKQAAAVGSITSFTPGKAPADFVGLEVTSRNGRKETIFSAAAGKELVSYKEYAFRGTYAVISEYNHEIQYLFLGNGRMISGGAISLTTTADSASAVLCKERNGWFIAGSQPFTLTLPQEWLSGKTTLKLQLAGKAVQIMGKKKIMNGKAILSFDLPALPYTQIDNDTTKALDYCVAQARRTIQTLPADSSRIPRSIANGTKDWRYVSYRDWTCGFWPGILWYAYEYTHAEVWKEQAQRYSRALFPLVDSAAIDHDLGFQVFNSIGNGYRLTHDTSYRAVLLRAADTLSKLFNPKVGTMLSWPRPVPGIHWPLRHNTIMDNMINLELLFWAAKNGGNKELYNKAVTHAATTMKNHFRSDLTSYHVVVYDTATGKKIKGITHQGYSDSSMWARGQSWAIYGFTMVYRETNEQRFLDFAQRVADVYLKKLPADLIPYWDFNAPDLPNAPRDASAAAVTASALLELSTFVKNTAKATAYRQKAGQMLKSLSTPAYQSREMNNAFLLHSTGHKPNGGEIDASIIYADYYYLEALLRLKKLKEGKNIYDKL